MTNDERRRLEDLIIDYGQAKAAEVALAFGRHRERAKEMTTEAWCRLMDWMDEKEKEEVRWTR